MLMVRVGISMSSPQAMHDDRLDLCPQCGANRVTVLGAARLIPALATHRTSSLRLKSKQAGGWGSRFRSVGCDLEGFTACLLLGRGTQPNETWATTCCVPDEVIPLNMGTVKHLQTFFEISDLGRELGVLLFADQVLELVGVVEADAKEPPRSVRLTVHDVRVLGCLSVDLYHLTADRRFDRRGGFLGLHMAHSPPGVQHVAQIG